MSKQSQISATVSEATKERLERFVESRGLKKNFVVEQALLYFIEARTELPDEALVPARLVLDDAAVRCFVDVARVVGVQTVAEFVDRPELLQRVREIGIDYAQGFLLHRPEPIEGVMGAEARHTQV